MRREALDFCNVRGDIAFLNGIYTVYMEEILYPVLKKHTMFSLTVDIFSIADGDDEKEIRVEKALSDHLKNYLELGYYDKNENFTPLPSNDDFQIPFEEKMVKVGKDDPADEIMGKALISFLKEFAVSEEKLTEAVKQFVLCTHEFLYSSFDGMYEADSDVIRQLDKNMHFQLLHIGDLFLKFGTRVMLLSIGYND